MISVIVCTYNRAQILKRMLKSFFEQNFLDTIDYELLVVDNNSSDDTRSVVDEFMHFLTLRYVFEEKQGLSIARNRGIAESKAEIVSFLDDDVIVDRNWLKRLWICFTETNADVVGGRTYLIFEKEPPVWLGRAFRLPLSLVDFGNERQFIPDGEGLFGLNLSFRKLAIKSAGGFDIKLGRCGSQLFSGEETVLIRRIASFKGRIVYDPDVVVGHIIGRERLEWGYFKKSAFGFGKTMARLEPVRNRTYQFLRVGKAFVSYIYSHLKLLRINLSDADPYEKKLAGWAVIQNKGYFAARLEQLRNMYL